MASPDQAHHQTSSFLRTTTKRHLNRCSKPAVFQLLTHRLSFSAGSILANPTIQAFRPGRDSMFSSVKWLKAHRKRLSCSSRNPRTRPFSKLPVEILHEILRYLYNFEIVLLSLTCRTMRYTMASSATVVLDSKEKRSLLSLLRRDLRGFYVCQFCVKMHRFQATFGPLSRQVYGELPPGSHCLNQFQSTCPAGPISEYRLAFHHVQLVMDGYFSGPSHGLPLDILAGETQSKPLPDFTASQIWQPRIIESELFLCATYRFTHSGSLYRVLTDFDHLEVAMCPHLCTSRRSGSKRIPDLEFRAWSFAHAHTPEEYQASGSCTGCLTDYRIFVSLSNYRYRVTIVTYHRLGYCRSPEDWKWQAYSPSLTAFARRTLPDRITKGYAAGEVRRAWDHDAVRREDIRVSHIYTFPMFPLSLLILG
jgi:hypothetical protein